MTLSKNSNGNVMRMTALAIVLAMTIGAFAPIAVGNNTAPATPESILQEPEIMTQASEPPVSTAAPMPEEPDSVVLQPNASVGKDTWISNGTRAFDNYGNDTTMIVGDGWVLPGQKSKSLLYFDVPQSTTAKLLRATLSLYQDVGAFNFPFGMNVSVYPLTRAWTEGVGTTGTPSKNNANWENATTGTPWGTPGADLSTASISYVNVSGSPCWCHWDVTSIVNKWINGSLTNYGFIMNGTPINTLVNAVSFYSSDYVGNTNLIPKLTISYAAEITKLVPAQTLNEDDPARNIPLNGMGSGTVEHQAVPCSAITGYPFSLNNQLHYQSLFTPAQVGAEGVLVGLSINRSTLNVGNYSNFRIQLAHSELNDLTANFNTNYNGNLVEVFNEPNFIANSSNLDTWIHFNLNGNFTYDSYYNLIVDISYTGSGGAGAQSYVALGTGVKRIYSVNGGPATTNQYIPAFRFLIDAVDNSAFDNGTMADPSLFNPMATYAKFQMLYNASDLGNQAGIIDKLGFYKQASTSAYFPNLNISIAYTNNNTNNTISSLSTNFSYNYIGQLTNVFYKANCSITNDSGWFDFDLTTNFNYDGHSNLLIQFEWSGLTVGGPVTLATGGIAGTIMNWTYTNTLGSWTGFNDWRNYNLHLTFADSANLTWSTPVQPDTSPFTATAGARILTITPKPDRFGTGTVALILTNSNGKSVTQVVQVTITAVNDPPVLAALANIQCVEDQPYVLNITGNITDIDDPVKNITVSTTSAYDTINGTVITFLYPEGVTGETVNVTIRDKAGATASRVFTTTVTMVNDEPMFVGFADNITCDATVAKTLALTPSDEETPVGKLMIYTNSQYVNVTGSTLHLLYPKGIGSEQVTLYLVDNLTYGTQNNISYLLRVTITDHPEVIGHTPNGTAVPVTTTIQATFDISMNATATQNAFALTLGTAKVNGTFAWTANGTVMTFTPTTHLTNGLYKVNIAASAETTAGVKMLKAFGWNFTAALGSYDGDGDGMPDQYEMDNGLDPNVNDADLDLDGDGMPNIYEYENSLNPQANDADLDADNDGYTNYEEYLEGTDPNDPDSKPSEFNWIIIVLVLVVVVVIVVLVIVLARKPKAAPEQMAEQGRGGPQPFDQGPTDEGNVPPPPPEQPPEEVIPPENGQPPQP